MCRSWTFQASLVGRGDQPAGLGPGERAEDRDPLKAPDVLFNLQPRIDSEAPRLRLPRSIALTNNVLVFF